MVVMGVLAEAVAQSEVEGKGTPSQGPAAATLAPEFDS
jgi:hypothetical protein